MSGIEYNSKMFKQILNIIYTDTYKNMNNKKNCRVSGNPLSIITDFVISLLVMVF